MKISVFIPARYGSSRFPGKPLASINGLPMIQHVYRRARQCPDVDDVLVATDDERILECVRGFGGKVLLTGKGHPSGTDRIAEAARKVGLRPEDCVINIQGDQPLFDAGLIPSLVHPLLEDPELSMASLMCPIRDDGDLLNPNHVKVVTNNRGDALYFSRAPIPFVRDGDALGVHFKHLGVYAYRVGFLSTFVTLPVGRLESLEKLEQLRALENGYRIKMIETATNSPEVDTPNDIARVEALMAESGSAPA